MPKRTDIRKIMVIGSGPIVIGQAAEFDYSGTQACLSLKEEGYQVVLVNSNPATIMTDKDIADKVYIEPITLEFVTRILRKERPDALLPTLGGQTGLNMAMALSKNGILEELNVELLGTKLSAIDKAEDRDLFKQLMEELNQPIPESEIVNSVEEAIQFAEQIGYPLIVRPAFTLGGTGGGMCDNQEQLVDITTKGLKLSPVTQCLIERSIAGFKEIEYEVMRDAADNALVVCNMENFDPVGIHTGDSIVFAPAQTLSDVENQLLRDASLDIIRALKIEGGCNVQLALDPNSFKYYVIEVNPRVSRSSALASKATGYPIAKLAAKIAVGLTLDEVINPITKTTYAMFEPALDYVVAKMPRFPFDKFESGDRKLGTQMKATGEVMAIGRNIEESLLKACRSLEIGVDHIKIADLDNVSDDVLLEKIRKAEDDRLFYLAEALRRHYSIEKLASLTSIDSFFLDKLRVIVELEDLLSKNRLDINILKKVKNKGFSDKAIASLWQINEDQVRNMRKEAGILPVYKMVDTCAAEFDSATPYFYSTYAVENESLISDKASILVLGSGPIRIGQGVEFDYATVHSVKAIRESGFEAIIMNSNPETVSTDFSISDKLYFEPLTFEDVMNVIDLEKPEGVILQFGGQNILIPGIMEHIERAGVHSGDSMAVYPPQTLSETIIETIVDYTKRLAIGLNCIGMMNIQFVIKDQKVYVIEVNPRASRTLPFLSKVTHIPMAQVATKVILGDKLCNFTYGYDLYPASDMVHIKAPVFSFTKLAKVDSLLGPEMKSTGEVMGSDINLQKALYKAFEAAYLHMPDYGNIVFTVDDTDKEEALELAKVYQSIGYRIYATQGTAIYFDANGLETVLVGKLGENDRNHIPDLIKNGKIQAVINTVGQNNIDNHDALIIRRSAIEQGVPLFTSLDTAHAMFKVLESRAFTLKVLD